MKRILLLPFCLSNQARKTAEKIAAEEEYVIVTVRSTSRALAEVRSRARSPEPDTRLRIVGVVCFGRAKKVWMGLMALKAWRSVKRLLCRRDGAVELAWVPIVHGSKSLFGRRHCQVGRNEPELAGLRRALQGHDTYMTV